MYMLYNIYIYVIYIYIIYIIYIHIIWYVLLGPKYMHLCMYNLQSCCETFRQDKKEENLDIIKVLI